MSRILRFKFWWIIWKIIYYMRHGGNLLKLNETLSIKFQTMKKCLNFTRQKRSYLSTCSSIFICLCNQQLLLVKINHMWEVSLKTQIPSIVNYLVVLVRMRCVSKMFSGHPNVPCMVCFPASWPDDSPTEIRPIWSPKG